MRDLDGLIEKIEGLEGPDPRADEAIWEAIGDWPASEYRSCDYMKAFGTPVTASIDAAIALVERVLRGWRINLEMKNGIADDVYLIGPEYHDDRPHEQSSPPIGGKPVAVALCLALLRALTDGGHDA